ncbi:MAG: hypothetical protein WBA68_12085 [Alteraurantiacibacter sp.]
MTISTIAAIALGFAQPGAADIVESSPGGFATSHTALVAADRRAVWNALVHPEG